MTFAEIPIGIRVVPFKNSVLSGTIQQTIERFPGSADVRFFVENGYLYVCKKDHDILYLSFKPRYTSEEQDTWPVRASDVLPYPQKKLLKLD